MHRIVRMCGCVPGRGTRRGRAAHCAGVDEATLALPHPGPREVDVHRVGPADTLAPPAYGPPARVGRSGGGRRRAQRHPAHARCCEPRHRHRSQHDWRSAGPAAWLVSDGQERNCAAVTAVASSAVPERIASSTAVQRDHLCLALTASTDMAEQSIRRGCRIWAWPRAAIDSQHQPIVRSAGKR